MQTDLQVKVKGPYFFVLNMVKPCLVLNFESDWNSQKMNQCLNLAREL